MTRARRRWPAKPAADGRILVVEYKGGHLLADAKDKQAVGEAWAKRSGGRCLFVMPTDGEFAGIRAAVRGGAGPA